MNRKEQELTREIDDLVRRQKALTDDAEPIRQQLKNIDKTRGELGNKIEQKRRALNNAATKKPNVTDHAVVRYLERKFGFDFEGVRNELLTPVVIAGLEQGAERVKSGEGYLILRGNKVITFVGKGEKP